MKIACQQCHAGKAYLEAIVEHLKETGDILQTVRCIRCGWRVSRPARGHHQAPVEKVPKGMHSAAGIASIVQAQKEIAAQYRRPCNVHGCDGTYHATRNPLGLCGRHNNRLRSWLESRSHKVAAPVQLVNGTWIERGQPLPGIA
jgi:hypothetical protein